jgi:hypothetical protein
VKFDTPAGMWELGFPQLWNNNAKLCINARLLWEPHGGLAARNA